MINSAYRGPAVNEKVGGSKSSQHMVGCAADLRIPGMNPDQVCRAIIEADLPFDQLIREFDSWVHISVEPRLRHMVLTIDSTGTREGIG